MVLGRRHGRGLEPPTRGFGIPRLASATVHSVCESSVFLRCRLPSVAGVRNGSLVDSRAREGELWVFVVGRADRRDRRLFPRAFDAIRGVTRVCASFLYPASSGWSVPNDHRRYVARKATTDTGCKSAGEATNSAVSAALKRAVICASAGQLLVKAGEVWKPTREPINHPLNASIADVKSHRIERRSRRRACRAAARIS